MPWVRSTLTRRTGLTTVNLFVKYAETSSPREAISAISSAVGTVLDALGTAWLFLTGRFPSRLFARSKSKRIALYSSYIIPVGLRNGSKIDSPGAKPHRNGDMIWS